MARSGQGRESKPVSKRGHVREASCGPDHGAASLYTGSAHRTGVRALRANRDLGPQLASSFSANSSICDATASSNPRAGGGGDDVMMCPPCGVRC